MALAEIFLAEAVYFRMYRDCIADDTKFLRNSLNELPLAGRPSRERRQTAHAQNLAQNAKGYGHGFG
jgi:hypothetical protein